jgi:hypothetical protein
LSKKARRPLNRIYLAVRLMRQGLSIGDAARRANVSEEQVRRVLGVGKKQLSEGEHMTEHGRKLGAAGLSYGTPAAEEMIAERTRKLEGKGYPDARSAAIGQLADEGNLRVLEDAPGSFASTAREGGLRELSEEQRQAKTAHEDVRAEARRQAKEKGISYEQALRTIMNRKAMRGEVKL